MENKNLYPKIRRNDLLGGEDLKEKNMMQKGNGSFNLANFKDCGLRGSLIVFNFRGPEDQEESNE